MTRGTRKTYKKQHKPLTQSKENGTDGGICPLCGRELPAKECSKHHLIPVVKGGRKGPTVILHRVCHSKIHSLFTEAELNKLYDTIEKLLANEDIVKFVKWIKNKSPDYYDSSKLANVRRR